MERYQVRYHYPLPVPTYQLPVCLGRIFYGPDLLPDTPTHILFVPYSFKYVVLSVFFILKNKRQMRAFVLHLFSVLSLVSCNAASWFNQDPGCTKPCIQGDESIMSQKEHGTSRTPVQSPLRWGCDDKVADQICNFNRHYAEYSGYWQATTFLEEVETAVKEGTPIWFYDSNTGKPLFHAPVNRSWEEFLKESRSHGWPSFRDDEVVWENVRVLPGGETVSVDGTHLGHNLPDGKGRRYCINLVSIAGNPNTSR